ncbi:TrkH family potassium uptake protein [Pseudooceanicola algae]|nr:TrkH family potassium uptake protein [Pseudooceanicola algae]
MNFVVFVNGVGLLFSAALMLMDAAIFPATRTLFVESALLTGFPGVILALASASRFSEVTRLHGFLLTSSIWVTAALAGAVPLAMFGLTPVDALFEAMSGITTTGATVMSGLDATPRGILLWRATLQAVGGVGFIVTGIALLPVLRVGGMQLFQTESSDRSDKVTGTAATFALATLAVYLGLMGLCAVFYAAGGMGVFDAITHAMTTLSTGGYSNYDASFGHFTGSYLQWVATGFMLAGALPFAWYIRAWRRGAIASEQVAAMFKTLAVVIAVLTAWLCWSHHILLPDALRLVAFNVVSVVTTTGYATTDYTLWGPVAQVAFLALTLVGGCTGSTSGGAKAMRWLLFARALRVAVRKVHAPHSVQQIRYEGRRVTPDVLNGVMAFFVFYAVTASILSVILAFLGMDLVAAVSGALTALANVGPGLGAVIGPAGNFEPLGWAAKLVLTAGMYLGRLEILTVYVLLMPAFWRETHRAERQV